LSAGSPVDLEVRDVQASYGASQVLFGVGLAVERGQTLALLGRNGAGKSTTFKAIAGLVPPHAGEVKVRGKNMRGRPPHVIARAGIGYVPEDRQVFPDHTVEDNLEIAAKKGPGGEEHWNLSRIFEVFPILAPLRNRRAGRLSGGEQQMLTIARALMGNPAILLLDEPSEGLAPLIVAQIGALIRRLQQMGATILIAEQNKRFCLEIATHVAIIDKGCVVYYAPVAEFRADQAVEKRYLAV
jgi:branched-chain amino acid transport system ATP-binding protein